MPATRLKPNVPHRGYVFGPYVLDIDRASLLHNGENVQLRPKSLDVLTQLVEHHGRLVGKEELLEAVWSSTAVSDDSLTHCLIEIRKVLGDTERKMIRTVPRRGFIFDLPVETISSAARHERRRSTLVAAIAAGLVLSIGAGYLLLFADQPGPDAKPAIAEPQFDQEAVDLRVRGHFLFNRRAPDDLETAEQLFRQAVDLEPTYARAWADLAGVYVLKYFNDGNVDAAILPLVKDAAEKAVALDSELAAGWVRLAHYYAAVGDQPAVDRYMQRALDTGSEDPLLLSVLAGHFADAGDLDKAIELQRNALAADPLSRVNRFNLSGYLLAAGRYDDSFREAQGAAQLAPDGAATEINAGFALIKLEQFELALELANEWPESLEKDVVTAMAGLVLNQKPLAMEAIERLRSSTDIESYRYLAELEAFCDNIENSFKYLALLRDETRDGWDPRFWRWQITLIKMSPFLAPVRADPRWQDWLDEPDRPLIAGSNKLPADLSVK